MTTNPCPTPDIATPGPLATAIRAQLAPRDAQDELLVEQISWAVDQLHRLMRAAPAQPDARWLRLFSLADRIYHRNLRLLQKRVRHGTSTVLTPSSSPVVPESKSEPRLVERTPVPAAMSPANSASIPLRKPKERLAPRPVPSCSNSSARRSTHSIPSPARPGHATAFVDLVVGRADPARVSTDALC